MSFPPFPRSAAEIYDFRGRGEYMACAIVHKFDMRQLMAFRKLRIRLGEQSFRETLVDALDILNRSTGIDTPAGWLYDFLDTEASPASHVSK